MITCIVVDDEQAAIDILKHYISQTPYLELIGSFTNPLQALAAINEQKPNLVFSDIQMPGISGLDLIKALNGQCRAILCTAYSEFAAEGFDLEVIDYLMKPVPFPRFLKAAQRAMQVIENKPQAGDVLPLEDDYLFVKTESKGKLLKINLVDIDYIEGMKNYVAIHHAGHKTLALLNMKDLEGRLPAPHFMRVQKSFIIPLRKIAGLEGNLIRIKNVNAEILLGESYRQAFLERVNDKLMGR